jgi:urease accessory protein
MAAGIGMSEDVAEASERSPPHPDPLPPNGAERELSYFSLSALQGGEGRAAAPISPIAWFPALLTWLSPSYPVGGFSYSHGLEWAVEAGDVRDRAGLEDYVATIIEAGAGWVDLVLLAEAWRSDADPARRAVVIELGAAWRGTTETALESSQQGAAFILATRAAWPGTALDDLDGSAVYPVAIGLACAGKVPLEAALLGYGHALTANFVSAGMRLVPLGQTDGQRAIANLAPRVAAAAIRAAETPIDDLGTAAFRIDLCSIHHETQYTRLFRS